MEQAKGRRFSVLLADDSQTVIDVLRDFLNESGRFEVVGTANDGRTAVELTQRLRPDLVVIDFNMPQANGIEAVMRIKSLDNSPAVILASLDDSRGVRDAALAAGADEFCGKLELSDELTAALDRLFPES